MKELANARELANALDVATRAAGRIDTPAYVYGAGTGLDFGYQVYCGEYDERRPDAVREGNIWAIVLPGGTVFLALGNGDGR